MSIINKKYTRVRAFTILEMLIGLVISAIIVSMVYFIYSNIYRQILQYSDQQVAIMEYNQFQNLLSSDISLSTHIKPIDHKHLKLTIQENEIDYFFEKEYIIRSTRTQDTFNLKVNSVALTIKEGINQKYLTITLKTMLLDQEIVIFNEKETSIADEINMYFLKEF